MRKFVLVALALLLTLAFAYPALAEGDTAGETGAAQGPYLSAYEKFEEECRKAGKYPDAYAGVYFKGKEFHVMVVGDDEAAIAELKKYFGDGIIIGRAEVSYNELLKIAGELDEMIKAEAAAANAWIDVKKNEVAFIVSKNDEKTAALANRVAGMEHVRIEHFNGNVPQTGSASSALPAALMIAAGVCLLALRRRLS